MSGRGTCVDVDAPGTKKRGWLAAAPPTAPPPGTKNYAAATLH